MIAIFIFEALRQRVVSIPPEEVSAIRRGRGIVSVLGHPKSVEGFPSFEMSNCF